MAERILSEAQFLEVVEVLRCATLHDVSQCTAALVTLLNAEVRASRVEGGAPEGWIPVKQQMPPPDVLVLVAWGSHLAVDKAHTYAKWKHPSHPLGYLIQGHPGSHDEVTHWMPLPPHPLAASPKDEKKNG